MKGQLINKKKNLFLLKLHKTSIQTSKHVTICLQEEGGKPPPKKTSKADMIKLTLSCCPRIKVISAGTSVALKSVEISKRLNTIISRGQSYIY